MFSLRLVDSLPLVLFLQCVNYVSAVLLETVTGFRTFYAETSEDPTVPGQISQVGSGKDSVFSG